MKSLYNCTKCYLNNQKLSNPPQNLPSHLPPISLHSTSLLNRISPNTPLLSFQGFQFSHFSFQLLSRFLQGVSGLLDSLFPLLNACILSFNLCELVFRISILALLLPVPRLHLLAAFLSQSRQVRLLLLVLRELLVQGGEVVQLNEETFSIKCTGAPLKHILLHLPIWIKWLQGLDITIRAMPLMIRSRG